MFVFEILQLLGKLKRVRTVDYSHSELCFFFVVTGMALSVISCISSVDSIFFADGAWFPTKKFMSRHICRINFHIRSNVDVIAGNRDGVNQSES